MQDDVQQEERKPDGDLAIRTLAMPANTNFNGDIFGGWVVSNMDLAGAVEVRKYTSQRITTVAIDSMQFIAPVKVGDTICCYGKLLKIGRTSIAIHIETWALGYHEAGRRIVTEGLFTYVAIDDEGHPAPVERLAVERLG